MKTKTLMLLCLLLGFSITHGSAQTLKKGAVVVTNTYTFTLNPDKTLNQWMDFYTNKYIPELEKNYPGMKQYVLWGDRGEKKNQIGVIMVFESVAVRDKYYPKENEETMSEAVKTAEEKMKAINDEADKYLLPGSTRTYTDWIVK